MSKLSLSEFPKYVQKHDPAYTDTRTLCGEMSDYKIIPCRHGQIGSQSEEMLWVCVTDEEASNTCRSLCRPVYTGPDRTVFHFHKSALTKVAEAVGAKLKQGQKHTKPSAVNLKREAPKTACVRSDSKGAYIQCDTGWIRPGLNRTCIFECSRLGPVSDALEKKLTKIGAHCHRYHDRHPDVAFDAFFSLDLLPKVARLVGAERVQTTKIKNKGKTI